MTIGTLNIGESSSHVMQRTIPAPEFESTTVNERSTLPHVGQVFKLALDLTRLPELTGDPMFVDDLGFSVERFLAGEESARMGLHRPLDEAMGELRRRHNSGS